MSGRPVNLKQAIDAAGGALEGHQAEYRVTLIRRIGPNREVFVVRDAPLTDFLDGSMAPIDLKPYDIIRVKRQTPAKSSGGGRSQNGLPIYQGVVQPTTAPATVPADDSKKAE